MKDFLVCIDSDGTAMDTMTIKHQRCFGPLIIPTWKLENYICDSSGLWDYAYHQEDKVISKDEMKQYIRNENNLRDILFNYRVLIIIMI